MKIHDSLHDSFVWSNSFIAQRIRAIRRRFRVKLIFQSPGEYQVDNVQARQFVSPHAKSQPRFSYESRKFVSVW